MGLEMAIRNVGLALVLGVVLCRGASVSAAASRPADLARFYVSPKGNDRWTGLKSEASRAGRDGPFATLERAQAAVRQALKQGRGARVLLRGGTYYLPRPLVFLPQDSGLPGAPVVYQAYRQEKPVLSGGTRVSGWKKDAQGRWQVTLPKAAKGEWLFSQLFVNGGRRYRPRLPKQGYYFIADALPPSPHAQGQGYDRFRFTPGQLKASWHDLERVEVLGFQTWTMARLPIESVDEKESTVSFIGNTHGLEGYSSLPKGNRFLVENVREALTEPGEWYLDRESGVLTYIPKAGESPRTAEVIAPRLDRLVELKGDIAGRRWVSNLRFKGITFAHTNWNCLREGNAFAQAEVNLPGVIRAEGARDCVLDGCQVTHIGTYAVDLGNGCKRWTISNCALTDLGAGGVKISGSTKPEDTEALTSHNVVTDCLMAQGGRVHPAGVGVWIGNSPYNRVEHNDIHDFYYTGISCGWSWGYGPSVSNHNTLAYNHIHHLGQGVLSDMGGIYTLGLAPGTVLHHNLIHDVDSFSYGGWGIYPDEGSTDLLIENNVAYRTKSAPFHQHYGRNNLVRNNIWAFGTEAQVMRTRAEEHLSFTFERNIVYWREGPLLGSNWSGNNYRLDNNLYWNAAGKPIGFAGMSLEEWQKKGQDQHSLIADPRFRDPDKGDFRLLPGSPADRIGFISPDLTGVGPRNKLPLGPGVALPRAYPPPPPPQPVAESFESGSPGQKVAGATTWEEAGSPYTVRITDLHAGEGRQSLRFADGPGQQQGYNPHLYWTPGFKEGVATASFLLRVDPGATVAHEWRDSSQPYQVGPSIVVRPDGGLWASGGKVGSVPLGQWVKVELSCPLGSGAKGLYDLIVTSPGQAPLRCQALRCSPEFRALQWFGFSAEGDIAAAFYLDDLHLGLRPGVAAPARTARKRQRS